MKIDDPRSVTSSPVQRPASATSAQVARSQAHAPAKEMRPADQPAARVELSSRSREMHEALAAAKAAPDVRADKVADVKQRIAQGTYKVNAEAVAKGILDTRA